MNRSVASTSGPIAERVNPFSSRYVRPGAVPFVYEAGDSADVLAERFLQGNGPAAIVGPHGSGKSTLLSELRDALRRRGCDVSAYELHDGGRRSEALGSSTIGPRTVVTIDGFEQLAWWRRAIVARRVRAARARLLVTVHRESSWPVLYRTRTSVELAVALARQLPARHASPADGDFVAEAEVRRLFDLYGGDLREVLFRLYDLYELRRS